MKFFSIQTADDLIPAKKWNTQCILFLEPYDKGSLLTLINGITITIVESNDFVLSKLITEDDLVVFNKLVENIESDFGFF